MVGEARGGLHLLTHKPKRREPPERVSMPSALDIIGAKMALKEILLDF